MQDSKPPRRVLSLRRWREYVKVLFPGLKLSRPKADLCDRCVRIDLELLSPDITPEREAHLKEEKTVHLQAAISQRKIWSNFVRDYTGKVDPNLVIPEDCLISELKDDDYTIYKEEIIVEDSKSDDEIEGEEVEGSKPDSVNPSIKDKLSHVQLQAEDYGGGIALPHYGFRRPSADYFNSNLMGYNFVIADISGGLNNVYFYDERHQGKGADALCSLRLRYHLRKLKLYEEQGVTPRLCMSLLDNCVGQNKSQLVMKFMCLLSICFYEQVALLYFLPGHSHMVPDRVVAHCKNAIKGLNLYSLGQITEECNRVKGVQAEWLQPDDFDKPFRVDWCSILDKFFKNLPARYTFNYFFEFSNGVVSYRPLANSPNHEATTVRLLNITPTTRAEIMMELFGSVDKTSQNMRNLSLPTHTGNALTKTKLKSLYKKYFSIPKKYLKYYPNVDHLKLDKKQNKENKDKSSKRKLASLQIIKKAKRKVGRPKKVASFHGLETITKFFRPT